MQQISIENNFVFCAFSKSTCLDSELGIQLFQLPEMIPIEVNNITGASFKQNQQCPVRFLRVRFFMPDLSEDT